MAQKIVTEYFDDVDGRASHEQDLTTIRWSWRGVPYEFDTTADNLLAIETGQVPLATLLIASQAIDAAPGAIGTSSGQPQVSLRVIRAWALEQGYTLGTRGRIAAGIVNAYHHNAA